MKTSRLKVKDKKGRILLTINELGKIAVARFPDSTEKEKSNILGICKAILVDEEDPASKLEKVRKFINFESDDDEFCS